MCRDRNVNDYRLSLTLLKIFINMFLFDSINAS